MALPNRDSVVTVFPHSDHYQGVIPEKRSAPREGDGDHETVGSPQAKTCRTRPTITPLVDDSLLFRPRSDAVLPADDRDLRIDDAAKPQDFQLKYRSILEEDQAGPCTVAHEMVSEFPLVVLKCRALSAQQRGRLAVTSHPNLVNIQNFHDHDTSVQIAYECMAVSLADVLVIPDDDLREYECAVLCKEVEWKLLLSG